MKKIITIILFISVLYGEQIGFLNNHFKTISNWKIDKSTHTLSMIKNTGAYFNLCFTQDTKLKNGTISVYFKANSGYMDQGGGLMWRVQDKNNYYVVRFNPLEDNFTYYQVINGRRITLKNSNIHL